MKYPNYVVHIAMEDSIGWKINGNVVCELYKYSIINERPTEGLPCLPPTTNKLPSQTRRHNIKRNQQKLPNQTSPS
ncbi:hypothetical protein CN894_21665 [Bacillus thuringiensis]|nr:hypothetical protein CN894_21665 [Bacillus thuringiensis]